MAHRHKPRPGSTATMSAQPARIVSANGTVLMWAAWGPGVQRRICSPDGYDIYVRVQEIPESYPGVEPGALGDEKPLGWGITVVPSGKDPQDYRPVAYTTSFLGAAVKVSQQHRRWATDAGCIAVMGSPR